MSRRVVGQHVLMPAVATRIRLVVGIVVAHATLLAVLLGAAVFSVLVGLPAKAPLAPALLPAMCIGALAGLLYKPNVASDLESPSRESSVAINGRRLWSHFLAWTEDSRRVAAEVIELKVVRPVEEFLLRGKPQQQ